MILPDVDITETQLPILLPELKKDPVKFIQLLCCTVGLNRNIVIRNGGGNFYAIGQKTAKLEIQIGRNHCILGVAEGNATAKASIVIDIPKIEKAILVPVRSA